MVACLSCKNRLHCIVYWTYTEGESQQCLAGITHAARPTNGNSHGLETPALEPVLSSKQGLSCKVTLQNSCARIEHSCLHGAQDCIPLFECEDLVLSNDFARPPMEPRSPITNGTALTLLLSNCNADLQLLILLLLFLLSLLKVRIIAASHF